MIEWLKIALAAVAAGIFATAVVTVFRRCSPSRTRHQNSESNSGEETAVTPRLHQVSPHHGGYHLFQCGVSAKQPPAAMPATFAWADHPSLVTDAVENGWSRFAFTSFETASSPSVRSFLGGCADSGDGPSVEVEWEVGEGSADFMQRIRLNQNPKPKRIGSGLSVIRTALPLPGPNLGNSSFPQEAYFEIRVLSCSGTGGTDSLSGESEGDKITLIGVRNSTDFVSHSQKRVKVAEMKQDGNRDDVVLLFAGLSGGGPLVVKSPGTYQGSVGFDSTGSVHLDGSKIISGSINNEWGRSDKVIGCGYNPNQNKVFFTVDSQLMHDIHCMSEEFSSPLYPTISATTNAVVLVNLGQSPFKFAPANQHRTPNPCFIGSLTGSSPALGYEDSRELFSMGRIDSQWQLIRNATKNSNNNSTIGSIKGVEYDQESEGDLFEIVLESTGKSPYNTVAVHQ